MNATEAEYWFLPKVPYTEGNDVVALVDGSVFMKHLYDRMLGMEAGDALFFTMWRGSPDQTLRPELSPTENRLLPLLLGLVRRGVIVRILAWNSPILSNERKGTIPIVEGVRKANRSQKLAGSAFMDQRLPSILASHHQKSLVLTQKGDPWAYVGGIDVAVDRWDTPDHTSPRERQRELLDGWHDVHCAIQGPAVGAIAENFRDRWNERKPPMRSSPGDLPDLIRAPLNVPSASRGSLMVQRLRTLACDGLYDFKPGGEQTSRQGINRAIDQSKYYVYIEDQYFWPSTTVERLTAAVRRGVHVFLVLAKAFDAPVQLFARAHYEMRKEALEMLRGAGADRVVCCHLEQTQSLTQIYVHSKFIIVDDRFVTIGSTNIGRRSHTTDTELNVSMVDAKTVDGVMGGRPVTVCRFAQDLRKRVWNEHLNIPESELHDPIASKGRWPQQRKGSKKVHHAAYHSGEPPAVPITLGDWYRFLKALREAARQPKPWPNATQAELTLVEDAAALLDTLDADLLQTGVSELALHGLGPIWWAPRIGLKARLIEFIKNRLMNVETKCGLA